MVQTGFGKAVKGSPSMATLPWQPGQVQLLALSVDSPLQLSGANLPGYLSEAGAQTRRPMHGSGGRWTEIISQVPET